MVKTNGHNARLIPDFPIHERQFRFQVASLKVHVKVGWRRACTPITHILGHIYLRHHNHAGISQSRCYITRGVGVHGTVPGMSHWLCINHAPGGNIATFCSTPYIQHFKIISNQLHTLIRQYTTFVYVTLLKLISAHKETEHAVTRHTFLPNVGTLLVCNKQWYNAWTKQYIKIQMFSSQDYSTV